MEGKEEKKIIKKKSQNLLFRKSNSVFIGKIDVMKLVVVFIKQIFFL